MNPLPLSVSPEAEAEALAAARWYEDRANGLGAAFLELVEQSLGSIADKRARFPIVARDVRRALLKRFPFGVFFRVRSDRIKILAILHLSRDPARWRSRQ